MSIKQDQAKEKLRKEAQSLKSKIAETAARQISDLIRSDADAECVLREDRKLADVKKKIDDYASKHRSGNESAFGPEAVEGLIVEYYGFSSAPASMPANETSGNVIDITSLL